MSERSIRRGIVRESVVLRANWVLGVLCSMLKQEFKQGAGEEGEGGRLN